MSRLNIYQLFIYDTLDEVLLFTFSSPLKKYEERQVCVCVYGWGKLGGLGGTEERGRNQYIFTESPCVAGTETGQKEREERKVLRGRKEVGEDGGRESCLSCLCLSVVSQLSNYS